MCFVSLGITTTNWNEEIIRETFLTKNECSQYLNNKTQICIKIDKRKHLTYKEWEIDNCSLSEHEVDWNRIIKKYGLKTFNMEL